MQVGSHREQINEITTWIDGSLVYGSTDDFALELREKYPNGNPTAFLRVTPQGGGLGDLLPTQPGNCVAAEGTAPMDCFQAGDRRVNEWAGLSAIHVLFLREHNRIARYFTDHTAWDAETVYQETRRIIGAFMQLINYREYLPRVLGDEFDSYDLELTRAGRYYKGYDDSIDPTIENVFPTSAFRFGHSEIRDIFLRKKPNGRFIEGDLSDSFSRSGLLFGSRPMGMESLLEGVIVDPDEGADRFFAPSVRDKLFKPPGELLGLDLPAINNHRSRDHGLPPYNDFREACNLRRIRSKKDLKRALDVNGGDLNRFIDLYYGDFDEIDVYPAGVSEKRVRNGLVGETFACIIGRTFEKVRQSDRYWFEGDDQPRPFSLDQLAEIKKVYLSTLICNVGQGVTNIQRLSLELPSRRSNPVRSCNHLPQMDLSRFI